MCEIGILCRGTALSNHVDHVIRAELYIAQHAGDETFFFDPDNLQGACQACHTHKTNLEEKGQWNQYAKHANTDL
jgi:5-methylcytosine-specific restriction endonuclease McrA